MKKKFLSIILLMLFLRGYVGATSTVTISFWSSSYYTTTDYGFSFALLGHLNEDDSPTTAGLGVPIPAGTFTVLTFVTDDPGSPAQARVVTLRKNGVDTSATCAVPGSAGLTCTWTGSVVFAEGDVADYKISQTGGLLSKGPYSIMTKFVVASTEDDWPWNA
jgi:hypothetical protein